jgi:hypothetical protein
LEVCKARPKFKLEVSNISIALNNDSLLSDSDMLDMVELDRDTEGFLSGSNDGLRTDETGCTTDIRPWNFKKIANWIEKKFVNKTTK